MPRAVLLMNYFNMPINWLYKITAYDPKRRHRPAPQTHQKLHSKQKDLLNKVAKEPDEDIIEDTTLLDLRNQALAGLALPVSYFMTSHPQSSFYCLWINV